MKLKAVILQNFRRYRNKTVVPIDRLTALIGRNDMGKSTILDALDIFFEGGTVKIDPRDASVGGDATNVRIGAVFENLPDVLDLDAGAKTTLVEEMLLNTDGDLEILKVYNCSATKASAPKVFACAMHPSAQSVTNLLEKKNADLKKLVKEAGLEANCQLNNNPSMRQALYAAVDDLKLAEMEVQLNKEDAKNVWEAIRRSLPIYSLFRSDRASLAQDPEAQSPMKLAVQKALAGANASLEQVSNEVRKMLEDTATRTLDHMKDAYPDMELASALKPSFSKPKWESVFKLDLESDDGIPINKRGSGVRRLVLLSFFQAEATRIRQERVAEVDQGVPVIYAIEEPETSQHPDNQESIIRALCEVSKGGDQVLITTHVPTLAGLLPADSLRFIDNDPLTKELRVRAGTEEIFDEVAQTLGVLPEAAQEESVKVAVVVEGPTDIDALISLSNILVNAGDIDRIDLERIFWVIGGGFTLKDWVERRYLDRLNIPQVFICDSDRTAEENQPPDDKINRIDTLNGRPNYKAFLTRKREIENYMNVEAVARISNNRILIDADFDLDYGDIENAFATALQAAKDKYGNNLEFNPFDHVGEELPLRKNKIKKIITAHVMSHMTADEVRARGAYKNDDGEACNEIIEWLTVIRKCIVG